MLQILKRNPLSVVIAILMHLAIIAFMLVGVDWLEKPKQVKVNVDVVQARVIDNAKVMTEVERLKKRDQERKKERESILRKEEKRLAELKQKQQVEKKRLADLEKQRKTEAKRKTEEKRKAELKRKAEDKRKTEAKRKAEKKRIAEAKQKAKLEKKRKAEAKRKAEVKRKAAAKQKAEREKKRKAEAARKAREAELLAAMEAEHNAREIDRYVALIDQKVVRNWLRPAGISDGLKCTLRVRLATGGNVIAVSVLKSSGNGAFDRAATAAVYKADPLPVPEGRLFERFRDINFIFDPN